MLIVMTFLCITGCATAPPRPYWDNPEWVSGLDTAIQSSVHYPLDEAQNGWPIFRATMLVMYKSGRLSVTGISKSSGSAKVDHYIVRQIIYTHDTPESYGSYAPVPHLFKVTLNLKPTVSDFYTVLRSDIEKHAHYPYPAARKREQGWLLVGFYYRNGSILGTHILQGQASTAFYQAVLREFKDIKLPPPPKSLKLEDKTLHFKIAFCFVFPGSTCVQHYRN
ncbi:MAG: energy transducer TonB [Gammaproteobacteria bacterium]